MNEEIIHLPSLDEDIKVEFEFIKDKDERGSHEYYVFYNFYRQTSCDASRGNLIWVVSSLSEKQIIEAEYVLDALRNERNEEIKSGN